MGVVSAKWFHLANVPVIALVLMRRILFSVALGHLYLMQMVVHVYHQTRVQVLQILVTPTLLSPVRY